MQLLHVILFVGLVKLGHSQFFDPLLDDKTYLDKVEEQIQEEVDNSALELLEQGKVAEKATRTFIDLKLRENVFQALRTIAEAELARSENLLSLPYPEHRVGRIDDDNKEEENSEAEAGEDDDGTTKATSSEGEEKEKVVYVEAQQATTELNGLSTAVKINQNVFNFLGEAVKTVFKGLGGTGGAGKATYPRAENEPGPGTEELVEVLPVLMKKPYTEQLVGLLSLFSSKKPQSQEKILSFTPPRVRLSHFLYGNKDQSKKKPTSKKNIDAGVIPDPSVVEYIDKLRSNHPYLLPDLYRGIDGANRFLESMSKVMDGIRKEVIQL